VLIPRKGSFYQTQVPALSSPKIDDAGHLGNRTDLSLSVRPDQSFASDFGTPLCGHHRQLRPIATLRGGQLSANDRHSETLKECTMDVPKELG